MNRRLERKVARIVSSVLRDKRRSKAAMMEAGLYVTQRRRS